MPNSNSALSQRASSFSPMVNRTELIELIVKRIQEKRKANTCYRVIPNLTTMTLQMLRETQTTGSIFELLWEGLNRYEGYTLDTIGAIMDSGLALSRNNIEFLGSHPKSETITGAQLATRLRSLT